MFKRALALSCVLAIASVANAGIDVVLDVTTMGPNAGGAAVDTFSSGDYTSVLGTPVAPGESLLVQVYMMADRDIDARIMQTEWGNSTYPWSLMGTDADTINQGIDEIPNFWFDYTGLIPTVSSFPAHGGVVIPPFGTFPTTGAHLDFSNLMTEVSVGVFTQFTTPQTAYDGAVGTDAQRHMTAGEWFHLGAMPITVPEGTESYVLDAITPTTPNDFNGGALIQFGFGETGDEVTNWSSSTGDPRVADSIQYGPYETRAGMQGGPIAYNGATGTFTVLPEPASLALLAIGGIAVLRRRRTA